MLNFDFQNPTRIVFGQGSVARLAELVPAQARVLVLYGGGSAERHGTLAEVEAALGGRTIHRFGGIEPNPNYETLMQAVELARRERLDFCWRWAAVPSLMAPNLWLLRCITRATRGRFWKRAARVSVMCCRWAQC